MITMPVEVYTDGSCLQNPGAGGYAYIIRYWDSKNDNDMPEGGEIQNSQGFRVSTNNRMEILAACRAIQHILGMVKDSGQCPEWQSISQVNLMSDSEYLCKAVNQGWLQKWKDNNWMTSGFGGRQPKDVKNKDLWLQILQIQDECKSMNINLTFSWVKGHNGNEYNERCDKMAVAAAKDGTNHLIDEDYEKTMNPYRKR